MALNLNSSLNINSGSLNITQTPRTSVIYDSGLIFSASVSDVSTIASGLFSITSSIVTLDSADTTFDRIDAIVAEFSGSSGQRITNISGTASADPQFPLLDYDSQIPLKYIRVKANATTPSSAGTNPQDQTTGTDFENVLLYNENLGVAGGEWDVIGSTAYTNWYTIPGNNLASTEQAYSGSVSIKNSMARVLGYNNVPNRLVFDYKRSQGNTIISSRLAGFSFYIKLTTDLSTSEPFLCAQFRENSPQNRDNQKTNGNSLTFPTFEDLGINTRNTTDWQYVTLPVTDFFTNINGQANENWVITSFQMGTGVRARNIPSNSFVYIDYVQMHLGSLPTTDPNNDGTSGNSTGVYKQGDTSFSIIPTNALSCVTSDFSTIGGGQNNTITGSQYSYIGAGQNNILASGSNYSSILGGSNNTSSYENSFIIGSNLTSNKACYTFMNNLDVEGTISASIFSGSFVGDGSNLTGISGSGSTNTGSLLTTASVSSNTITFTKGDNSTFDITVNTGSGGGGGNSITVQDNGTPLTTDLSLLNFVGATVTEPTADNVTVTIGAGLLETGEGTDTFKDVFGGHVVAAPSSSIVGGIKNTIACTNPDPNFGSFYNFIGGGFCNCISGSSYSTIVGASRGLLTTGSESNNTGPFNLIVGGQQNTAGGGYSSVIGGDSNVAIGCSSTIVGGVNNQALGKRSSILGGSNNTVVSHANCSGHSTIIGSRGSTVDTCYNNNTSIGEVIVGGSGNSITGSACLGAILGGGGHTVCHRRSAIIGGVNLTTQAENTAYVENLHISSSYDQANYLSSILTLNRRETTPDSSVEGMIMASGSAGSSKLYYYNGSSWNSLF